VLQAQSVFVVSSPVLTQDSLYSISDDQVSWKGIRAKFYANNHSRLRIKSYEFGKSSEWINSPAYAVGGQTPFAISVRVDLSEREEILMDIGSVKLTLDNSSKHSPTTVNIAATAGNSVCHYLTSGNAKYGKSAATGIIALADLPQRYGIWGCIRFIFDFPVEEMNPSRGFSFTAKFIVDGIEQTETVYFGPQEYTIINR